jgi:hypothetical protein
LYGVDQGSDCTSILYQASGFLGVHESLLFECLYQDHPVRQWLS